MDTRVTRCSDASTGIRTNETCFFWSKRPRRRGLCIANWTREQLAAGESLTEDGVLVGHGHGHTCWCKFWSDDSRPKRKTCQGALRVALVAGARATLVLFPPPESALLGEISAPRAEMRASSALWQVRACSWLVWAWAMCVVSSSRSCDRRRQAVPRMFRGVFRGVLGLMLASGPLTGVCMDRTGRGDIASTEKYALSLVLSWGDSKAWRGLSDITSWSSRRSYVELDITMKLWFGLSDVGLHALAKTFLDNRPAISPFANTSSCSLHITFLINSGPVPLGLRA